MVDLRNVTSCLRCACDVDEKGVDALTFAWLDALTFGLKGPPRDISKTACTIWSKFWPGRGGVGGGAPTKFGVD